MGPTFELAPTPESYASIALVQTLRTQHFLSPSTFKRTCYTQGDATTACAATLFSVFGIPACSPPTNFLSKVVGYEVR